MAARPPHTPDVGDAAGMTPRDSARTVALDVLLRQEKEDAWVDRAFSAEAARARLERFAALRTHRRRAGGIVDGVDERHRASSLAQ